MWYAVIKNHHQNNKYSQKDLYLESWNQEQYDHKLGHNTLRNIKKVKMQQQLQMDTSHITKFKEITQVTITMISTSKR